MRIKLNNFEKIRHLTEESEATEEGEGQSNPIWDLDLIIEGGANTAVYFPSSR